MMSSTIVVQPISTLYTSSLVITIMAFMVFFSFIWILLYTFRPMFVMKSACADEKETEPDVSKCFVAAMLIAAIIIFLMWLVGNCSC